MDISGSESGSKSRSGRNRLLGLVVCIAMFAGIADIAGCHRQANAGQTANDSGPDPADANMAPPDDSQQPYAAQATTQAQAPAGQNVQNESEQRADEYRRTGAQAGAPPPDQQSAQQDQNYDQNYDPNNNQSYANDQNYDDQNYDNQADAGQQAIEQADQPPPPLPVYVQPYAPGPNYIWTPGYWAYSPMGYYWVPGAWVAAPYYGALWTPGYWGFYNNRYRFHRGYWGPYIGFYGGVQYGFGYTGRGYYGGYWRGNNFYYNRTVNRINVTNITYVYNRPVVMNNYTRVAYNGGRGGLQVRPNRSEIVAMRGPKTRPMSAQLQNQRQAAQNRQQFFNQNKGRPSTAVIARPLVADKGIQRPVARPIQANRPQVRPAQPGQPNQVRPGQPNQVRPGQPNQSNEPGRIENRPNQPQVRPAQPGQITPNRPQITPVRPEQSVQPQRPNPPQGMSARPETRQIQPQSPQVRPVQPQTRPVQPQVRPVQPERPVQPQVRPMQQQRPMQPQRPIQPQQMQQGSQAQPRPAMQARPQPQRAETPGQQRQAPRNENQQQR